MKRWNFEIYPCWIFQIFTVSCFEKFWFFEIFLDFGFLFGKFWKIQHDFSNFHFFKIFKSSKCFNFTWKKNISKINIFLSGMGNLLRYPRSNFSPIFGSIGPIQMWFSVCNQCQLRTHYVSHLPGNGEPPHPPFLEPDLGGAWGRRFLSRFVVFMSGWPPKHL